MQTSKLGEASDSNLPAHPCWDAVIAGAGPAGAITALVLARRGYRVLLLDSRTEARWKIGETLPPAGIALLRRLELADLLEADGHRKSYGNRSAWGGDDLVDADFIFDPAGYGWQLDRRSFETRLVECARQAGAHVLRGCELLEANPDSSSWMLTGHNASGAFVVRSTWVADATGRCSRLARHLGARRRILDTQVCVYAVFSSLKVAAGEDQDARTTIEAAPEGWWYTALMPSGYRTVAYLTDADLIRQSQWRSADWFLEAVARTKHLSKLLKRFGYTLNGAPRLTSAQSARLDRYVGSRWIALGDAAFCFDPLSSRGIFNAVYTGQAGGEVIANAISGDPLAVVKYAESLENIWHVYVHQRWHYYRSETRWRTRSFWSRRIAAFVP
jgi:flavin-dependent dehydrogenase